MAIFKLLLKLFLILVLVFFSIVNIVGRSRPPKDRFYWACWGVALTYGLMFPLIFDTDFPFVLLFILPCCLLVE